MNREEPGLTWGVRYRELILRDDEMGAFPRPKPVVGLLLAGSLLVLLEGLIELALPISGVVVVIPGLTVALGVLLLLLIWPIATEESPTVAVIFIVLGGASFLLGGGFIVGGVLIVIAGALELHANWVLEVIPHYVTALARQAGPPSTPEPPPRSPPQPDDSPQAHLIVYSHCPSCGELNPRGTEKCSACGSALT